MRKEEFRWDEWFLDTYWPENAPRMDLMPRLAIAHSPRPENSRLQEVGCAYGYAAALFRLLGFQVADADADRRREELQLKFGIPYNTTSINDPEPPSPVPDASFDCVLLGEEFEQILNNPLGLLKALNRILQP